MKKKFVFCIALMLCLFFSASSFALTQPVGQIQEKSVSLLDTVVVFDCVKTPIFADSPPNNRAKGERELGTEILVRFSNGLVYDYIRTNQELAKELEEKGPNHIYNVFVGDVVIVRVVITATTQRIVEFVANLSAR